MLIPDLFLSRNEPSDVEITIASDLVENEIKMAGRQELRRETERETESLVKSDQIYHLEPEPVTSIEPPYKFYVMTVFAVICCQTLSHALKYNCYSLHGSSSSLQIL